MKKIGVPSYVSARHAGIGALIIRSDELTEIGIVVGNDGDSALVGWLKSSSSKSFGRYSNLSVGEMAFSFGQDWALEVDFSKGVTADSGMDGGLLLGPAGPIFRFRGVGQYTGSKSDQGNDITNAGPFVAIAYWKIWADENARYAAGASPLLSSEAG